ncbi:hypothetical protein B0A72_19240 [Flavobacterium pectinovorum]|uniref:Uncharacterized protein n=2 Tax=Flavobacterium pectinovorum TaxID=29533 RepID=A0AB36NWF1_9FLAO|nr:hypothetical protein B0A72_19240 [Flavobacterium pectinovorum]
MKNRIIMKTLIKSKVALLVILAGLAFSCKKTDTVPADSTYDSTDTTVDSINAAAVDTTMVPTDTTAVKDTTATTTPK